MFQQKELTEGIRAKEDTRKSLIRRKYPRQHNTRSRIPREHNKEKYPEILESTMRAHLGIITKRAASHNPSES